MHRNHLSMGHHGQPGDIWQARQFSMLGGPYCAAVCVSSAAQGSASTRCVMWNHELHAASMGFKLAHCAGHGSQHAVILGGRSMRHYCTSVSTVPRHCIPRQQHLSAVCCPAGLPVGRLLQPEHSSALVLLGHRAMKARDVDCPDIIRLDELLRQCPDNRTLPRPCWTEPPSGHPEQLICVAKPAFYVCQSPCIIRSRLFLLRPSLAQGAFQIGGSCCCTGARCLAVLVPPVSEATSPWQHPGCSQWPAEACRSGVQCQQSQ